MTPLGVLQLWTTLLCSQPFDFHSDHVLLILIFYLFISAIPIAQLNLGVAQPPARPVVARQPRGVAYRQLPLSAKMTMSPISVSPWCVASTGLDKHQPGWLYTTPNIALQGPRRCRWISTMQSNLHYLKMYAFYKLPSAANSSSNLLVLWGHSVCIIVRCLIICWWNRENGTWFSQHSLVRMEKADGCVVTIPLC